MGLYHSPRIATSGLVVALDAANTKSYPGSGTTLTDMSGNSNTSALTNGPTYSSANGGTIVFDGANDYIDCGPVSRIGSSLTEFTASVWVKPAASATSCILENGDNFVTNTFYIFQENALYFTFLIYDGVGYDAIYANYVYQTNTWYNLVGTWSSGNRIRFYTNGVLAEGTRIGAARTTVISGNKNLFAGIRPGATLTYPFAGSMANIQLYTRALTAAEVNQNFNALRGRFGL